MDLKEVKERIKEIESLSYDEHTPENYKEFLEKIRKIYDGNRQLLVSPYYTDSFTCFRARSNDKKFFERICDVWYPPAEKVTPGRLNFPNEPIFYCATDLNTAVIEIRPKLNDLITILETRITEPEMRCLQFVKENYNQGDLKNMDPVKKEIFEFVHRQLRSIVPDGQFQGYYATQIFKKAIDNTKFDAIAYDSVATSFKGYNFAIHAEYVDKHSKFVSARVVKVIEYNNQENFKVKCLFKSSSKNDLGKIEFDQFLLCDGHSINLKNYGH